MWESSVESLVAGFACSTVAMIALLPVVFFVEEGLGFWTNTPLFVIFSFGELV